MKKTRSARRGYGQHCALAKALDVIGDRWTLLIVRELLLRGPCRYTDIRTGLPGVATNLLADRLKELEQAGILTREVAPPPVAATLLRLTPRGEELRAVVHAVGRWGGALLGVVDTDDAFCSHWLALPLEMNLEDRYPDRAPISVEVRTGDQPIVIETIAGKVRTRLGRSDRPDVVLSGPPHLVLRVLMGKLTIAAARRQGLRYDGSAALLRRLQPAREERPVSIAPAGSSRRVPRASV
jgi:DNA-binding HxlR family transcriptional regulator